MEHEENRQSQQLTLEQEQLREHLRYKQGAAAW